MTKWNTSKFVIFLKLIRKTPSFVFRFSFRATTTLFFFSYECSTWHRPGPLLGGKIYINSNNWYSKKTFYLDSVIKHKYLISEEWAQAQELKGVVVLWYFPCQILKQCVRSKHHVYVLTMVFEASVCKNFFLVEFFFKPEAVKIFAPFLRLPNF